jgi:hypothetical protein
LTQAAQASTELLTNATLLDSKANYSLFTLMVFRDTWTFLPFRSPEEKGGVQMRLAEATSTLLFLRAFFIFGDFSTSLLVLYYN